MTITMRRLWLALGFALVCSAGTVGAQTTCAGDCNEDGSVLVDELLIGIGIALEDGSPVACMTADSNGSGKVEIQVLFNMLRMDVDDRDDPARFELNGGITSPCFGGAVAVSTQMALQVFEGELCPRAGEIGAGTSRIFYRFNQNVEIDADGDGSVEPPTYPNCLDPRLYQCLA